ncbi:thioredoxin family protein [Candidatus Bathyarchaeota archaeon]|nr:thioredoxin family protein [Candidatus Bathyarchaeota archaeon]
MKVEVIGPNPPCPNCKKTEKNVREAAQRIRELDVSVEKLDVMAPETMERYGIIRTPAIAVDGSIKLMGRVPSVDQVERLLRETL